MMIKSEKIIFLDIVPFMYEQACKPGYVVNDHLSRTAVANSLKRPT